MTKDKNLKIGIIDHLATGEGRTIWIICNYAGTVPDQIDSYFGNTVEWFSIDIFTKSDLTDDEEDAVGCIKEYAPGLKKSIERFNRKAMFSYCQEYHFNFS